MAFPDFTEACPVGAFQKTVRVTDQQTDAFGRMSPGALARQIGDSTIEHMAVLGVDHDTLRTHGLLWVLARTAIWVHRLPRQGETVLLRTWSGAEKHWMYPRRCEMFSSEGERLVSACSQWLLIDTDTRSLAPPSELMLALPVISLPDEPKLPAMTMRFPAELAARSERIVQPREIDMNGHVNNSYYLDWSAELLDPPYLRQHALHFLWVEYSRELYEGQQVSLHYVQRENALFVRGHAQGEDSFSLKMEYAPL